MSRQAPTRSTASVVHSMKPVEAPPELDFARLRSSLELCGTRIAAADGKFQEEAAEWYRQYRLLPAPRLPLVVPYFLDLASLIIHDHPQFRRPHDVDSDRQEYLKTYLNRHLAPLAEESAVRFVRRQLGRVREDRRLAVRVVPKVVARFVQEVMVGLTRFWQQQGEPYDQLLRGCGARWLPELADVRQFLEWNTEIVAGRSDLRDLIAPLERFLLGAARVESPYERANGELIAKCLASPEVTQHLRRPHPVVRSVGRCTGVSNHSGELVSIRGVSKTTELRKVAQVVASDLALLRSEPDGMRRFVSKMTHEGVLVWQRQHVTDRVYRKRILICFAAAVGETVNHFESAIYFNPRVARLRGTAQWGHSESMDTHARQLVFNFSQDIGRFWGSPGVHLDLHVLLEDVGGGRSRNWQMTWNELEECFYGDRYDFMVETEARAPGYFFEQIRSLEPPGSLPAAVEGPRQYIERLLTEGGYDGMVFVLLGSTAHLFDLVPRNVRRRGRRERRDVAVKLVALGNWPDHVEVASAHGFGELELRREFEFTSDVDLRYSVLAAVFGVTRQEEDRESVPWATGRPR